jgi:hypothetical protein
MLPHEDPETECSYISTLTLTSALERGRWSTPHLARFTLKERDPVPIVQETVWAPGPMWTDAGNLTPTGIRSQTVQTVASRYLGPCRKTYLRIVIYELITITKITTMMMMMIIIIIIINIKGWTL